jgi:hypothetical protein
MKKRLRHLIGRLFVLGKPKIFCIGMNKTGTTTLQETMAEFGYRIGRQREAEKLFPHWEAGDFRPIIQYCRSAQFFQDSPFSYPGTYRELDKAFPGSRFILTIRDSPEQWYSSITKFHAKKFGKNGRIPTREDLENATYVSHGQADRSNRAIFGTPADEPYHRETLITVYERHIEDVKAHFANRLDDLLIINVSIPSDYARLCEFLGKPTLRDSFPWANKT